MSQTLPAFTAQDALVAVMVAVSVSDENIRTSELVAIERQVNHLPVFAGFPSDRLREVAQTVYALMAEEDGLDTLFALVRTALHARFMKRPMRSPVTSPRPTSSSARPNFGCWKRSERNSTSTASTPPPSNSAPARAIAGSEAQAP